MRAKREAERKEKDKVRDRMEGSRYFMRMVYVQENNSTSAILPNFVMFSKIE